jgi:uncharacterized protein YkwD
MSRKTIRNARPQVEQLEDRRLLASHILFNPVLGVVTVQGTPRNDALVVSYAPGGTVLVRLTGGARQTARVPASAVNQIVFHGNGGRDRVLDRTAVPVFTDASSAIDARRARRRAAGRRAAALAGLTPDELLVGPQTNGYRVSSGLAPLTVNPLLEQMAHGHAANMATQDQFGDTGNDGHVLDGHDMVWRAAAVGYQWRTLGENVGYSAGFADPGQELMDQWLSSPEHQANLLDPSFTQVGIGVAQGASGRTYGVEDFGAPA